VLLGKGDGEFGRPHEYETSRGPYAVAISDLNGDGKPDVATANPDANNVSILLNKGDGTFKPRLAYATGKEPSGIAVGDMNGDRKPDLVTANSKDNTVSVLLNKGIGNLPARHDFPTGRDPESIAIGDLNGDGKPDVATANFDGVSVLLNKGAGSLETHKIAPDYEASYDSIAIGDLNGDGKNDLAAADSEDLEVDVFLNKGGGAFSGEDAQSYDTDDNAPYAIAIGDVNGDRAPDLATANSDNATVSVFANRGKGTFGASRQFLTAAGPHSVAIGDVNRDSKPDLASANAEDGTVSVLLNRSGPCTVPSVIGKRLDAASRTVLLSGCRVGQVTRVYSRTVAKSRVVSQRPRAGTALPPPGSVELVVSLGRKR
jgi:VCBS repeat protein/PASTA domain-containing protein